MKKGRNRLDDAYIKWQLTHHSRGLLRSKDIPPELVEVKRVALARKRNATKEERAGEQFAALTKKCDEVIEYYLNKIAFMIMGRERPLSQDDKNILQKLARQLSKGE